MRRQVCARSSLKKQEPHLSTRLLYSRKWDWCKITYLGDGAALDKRGLVGGLGGWNKWRGRGNVGRSAGSAECHSDSIWHTLDQLVGGRVEDWGKHKKEQQKLQFRIKLFYSLEVKHLLPQATFIFIFYQYCKIVVFYSYTLCSEVSSIIMAQNTSQSILILTFRCTTLKIQLYVLEFIQWEWMLSSS